MGHPALGAHLETSGGREASCPVLHPGHPTPVLSLAAFTPNAIYSCQMAVRSCQVLAAKRDLTEESIPAAISLGSCSNERGERLIISKLRACADAAQATAM